MPRREAADDEDMMARCPRCRGNGDIHDVITKQTAPCPICTGTGRVTRSTLRAYRRNPL